MNYSIEVLIATMHQDNYDILDKLRINTDAVVVNQCNEDSIKRFTSNGNNILWINTTERGLSKSRNMAIKNSTADICLIADDDEELCDNYNTLLTDSFKSDDKASVITFKIQGIEKPYKQYPNKSHQFGYLNSMKISSVEIAFRRQSVTENNIVFDELIGAGTNFLMGEENSFLFKCLNKKLIIKFIPKTIARLHIGNSTWFTGYNKNYFIGKGAAFTSTSKKMSVFLILQFAIRKYNLYKKNIGIIKAIKYMFNGKKEYNKILKNRSQL